MLFHPRSTRWLTLAAVATLALGLTACPSTPDSTNTSTTSPTTGTAPNSPSGTPVSLSGLGATLPEPLYQSWFNAYKGKNPNIQVNYEGKGSGAGVKSFLNQEVDFAATDAPLSAEERAKFPADRGKILQVPTTGGIVVFAYNLDGVDNLKLSRATYCGIVDGTVKTWNDPKIAKDNAGTVLPRSPITFVHRSDSSGTTYIFTSHIAKACPNWKAGEGKSVAWPTGVGGKGNPGVTALVKQTPGSIGYTEYAYAKTENLKSAILENKSNKFVEPTPEGAAKAFDGATVPEDFAIAVPDPAAADAYPIVGMTWLLLYEKYPDSAKAQALKDVVKWSLSDEGKQYAVDLGYLPLSGDLVTQVVSALDTIKVAAN